MNALKIWAKIPGLLSRLVLAYCVLCYRAASLAWDKIKLHFIVGYNRRRVERMMAELRKK